MRSSTAGNRNAPQADVCVCVCVCVCVGDSERYTYFYIQFAHSLIQLCEKAIEFSEESSCKTVEFSKPRNPFKCVNKLKSWQRIPNSQKAIEFCNVQELKGWPHILKKSESNCAMGGKLRGWQRFSKVSLLLNCAMQKILKASF